MARRRRRGWPPNPQRRRHPPPPPLPMDATQPTGLNRPPKSLLRRRIPGESRHAGRGRAGGLRCGLGAMAGRKYLKRILSEQVDCCERVRLWAASWAGRQETGSKPVSSHSTDARRPVGMARSSSTRRRTQRARVPITCAHAALRRVAVEAPPHAACKQRPRPHPPPPFTQFCPPACPGFRTRQAPAWQARPRLPRGLGLWLLDRRNRDPEGQLTRRGANAVHRACVATASAHRRASSGRCAVSRVPGVVQDGQGAVRRGAIA